MGGKRRRLLLEDCDTLPFDIMEDVLTQVTVAPERTIALSDAGKHFHQSR
jgi:hypothetical protein